MDVEDSIRKLDLVKRTDSLAISASRILPTADSKLIPAYSICLAFIVNRACWPPTCAIEANMPSMNPENSSG